MAARMIPGIGPRDFVPQSREGEIYKALSLLPEEFTVVHSLRLVLASAENIEEREADFVVFNKDLGILCVEAKAGRVYYEDGAWFYGNGNSMRRGGPYIQASTAKHALMDLIRDKGLSNLLQRCKVHHAVWFPSVKEADIKNFDLPPEASPALTLFQEDLQDPERKIRQIFDLKIAGRETELTEREADALIERILCPQFDLIPGRRLKYDLRDQTFLQLLNSQKTVLDFLVDQKSAVINGVAGSGKTLIAIERARRLNEQGDRVLFLCYNSLLQSDIKERCKDYPKVDVYTIAAFACKETDSREPDYLKLNSKLEWYFEKDNFPYKHVIVDEGQDFGLDAVNQTDVLQTLSLLTEQNDGSFFLFYDKNQLVQGSGMPRFIEEADCKLSLYVNCRNTKNIALCSMSALTHGGKCITREEMVSGAAPKVFASTSLEDQASFIDKSIEELESLGLENIVILTCKTEQRSSLKDYIQGEHWKTSGIPFYTCRRFKGLEADAVILVDVDDHVWLPDSPKPFNQPADGLLFYTGASRAKHELRIVCDMDERQCVDVLEALEVAGRRKPFRELAKRLKAKPA